MSRPGPQPDGDPAFAGGFGDFGDFGGGGSGGPGGSGGGAPGQWLPPVVGADQPAPIDPQPTFSPLSAMVPTPSSASEAVAMAVAGLGWLAGADLGLVPVPAMAECLRGLEAARSAYTAASARVLAGFCAQRGYEDDGQCSPRTWLAWQTRITRPAANATLAWARRLDEHPKAAAALAAAEVSASWVRQICDWTDQLPADVRDDADVILLAAARGGADLASLAELFEEIRARTARPDSDGRRGDQDNGFADRRLRLGVTLGGAARLDADLTPRAAAALRAVLDSLAQRRGPEDVRTEAQREHDALEEACQRLIAAGCLPDRAGQPVRLQLQMSLDDLLHGAGHPHGPGCGGPRWPAARGFAAAGPGDDCDASVAPMVTGRVDHDLLNALADRLAGPDRAAARQLILTNAVALLSGPGGLASWLRTGTLPPPAASISLPLDVGAVTDLVPPHLRRAIIARDRHCAAPGCDQLPAACHVHHIIPRSRGGPTSLGNCLLLCPFHHLILIHRWGWSIALHPDGTTTMTSPGGRTRNSHGPPAAVA